jgi:hypothetical protein
VEVGLGVRVWVGVTVLLAVGVWLGAGVAVWVETGVGGASTLVILQPKLNTAQITRNTDNFFIISPSLQ